MNFFFPKCKLQWNCSCKKKAKIQETRKVNTIILSSQFKNKQKRENSEQFLMNIKKLEINGFSGKFFVSV